MPKYRMPSGRFGGGFPGQPSMRNTFPRNSEASRKRSAENSAMMAQNTRTGPSAPGAAARPELRKSGREDPLSPVPTSILRSGSSTYGPLEYATADKSHQGFFDQNQLFENTRDKRAPNYRGKVRP